METRELLICFVVTILTLVVLRVIHILPATKFNLEFESEQVISTDIKGKKLMVFLGSGGHTGEILRILSQFDPEFLRSISRRYLISSGDTTSIMKLKDFENSFLDNHIINYIILPRARNVQEKLIISVKNSLISMAVTFKILIILLVKDQLPDVLLINGPGTLATLSYLIMILKFFKLCDTKIIYIESLARVKKLSISGKLVRPISDRFIVQWEALSHGRLEYYGILV